MNILVTGGAGYIGSHTVAQLLRSQDQVVVYDNLSKGHRPAVPEGVPFVSGDIRDRKSLAKAFGDYHIDAVIHFAASSLVGESMERPSTAKREGASASAGFSTRSTARHKFSLTSTGLTIP